jgi:hypothetical protein
MCVRQLVSTVHRRYLYYGANYGNLEYYTMKQDAYVLKFWYVHPVAHVTLHLADIIFNTKHRASNLLRNKR